MGVRLDEKHGLNPSVTLCFFCQEEVGLVLLGKLTSATKKSFEEAGIHCGPDGEAPRKITMDKVPCDKCKQYMEVGIILISCSMEKSKSDMQNPYRTGGWVVVKEEYVKRVFGNSEETLNAVLGQRVAFIDDADWDAVGLPRGAVEGVPNG